MQSINIFFLLLLSLLCFNAYAKNKCYKLVSELGNLQSKFVDCSVRKSVPVALCVGCVHEHINMTEKYSELLKKENNCTDIYFDKDRINIVSTMQNLLNSIWTKAYCEDCFTHNNTYIFDGKMTAFENCKTLNSETVCLSCVAEYLDLNTFYKKLDPNNQNTVCYDIQDAMNRTRLYWSKTRGCCQREKNLTLFIVAINIMALIPIIFYSSAYFLTKRRERNHGLLNEQTPDLNGTSTGDLITAAILATPGPVPEDTPPLNATNFKSINDTSSDSSDEDNYSVNYDKTLNKHR